MLTDIFAYRYKDIPLWEKFDEGPRRLLIQGFRIVSDQLFPYYDDGKEKPGAKKLWNSLNKQLAMELGQKDLSPTSYGFYNPQKKWIGGTWTPNTVCENFVCAKYDGTIPSDQFIKERLSFIEIAFRKREEQIEEANAGLTDAIARAKNQSKIGRTSGIRLPGTYDPEVTLRARNESINRAFQASSDELNARFRQAGAKLHYHNGFIQFASDKVIGDEIEQPFWHLVSDPKWANIDHDMKEALDLRDTGGRDPAWYAAKALESAIKIISSERGWTHGRERGAANFIDNLRSRKNGEFINDWERNSLLEFFSKVRNPFGHGAGSDQMPTLTDPQTDWAIQFAMIWIRNLIRRM